MNLKSRKKILVRHKDKKLSSRLQKQKLRKSKIKLVRKLSVNKIIGKSKILKKVLTNGYVHTGISGLDELFEKGIPKWASILVAGGPGSGKTILCLQILANAAAHGERCLYISFEESEKRLLEHMDNFGFNGKELIKTGNLKIIRKDPFVLASSVEALLANAHGELLIDVEEVLEIIPPEFKPDWIVFDSISTIATILPPKEEGYRVFIEQLFRYLESLDITSFLISETEQVPVKYSDSGVEEFLADGVIALYNYRKQNIRVSALEVIKMRGAKIEKKMVPFEIIGKKGIVVYSEAMVFEDF